MLSMENEPMCPIGHQHSQQTGSAHTQIPLPMHSTYNNPVIHAEGLPPTLLRVKRKRNEHPLDTLQIQHKISRHYDSRNSSSLFSHLSLQDEGRQQRFVSGQQDNPEFVLNFHGQHPCSSHTNNTNNTMNNITSNTNLNIANTSGSGNGNGNINANANNNINISTPNDLGLFIASESLGNSLGESVNNNTNTNSSGGDIPLPIYSIPTSSSYLYPMSNMVTDPSIKAQFTNLTNPAIRLAPLKEENLRHATLSAPVQDLAQEFMRPDMYRSLEFRRVGTLPYSAAAGDGMVLSRPNSKNSAALGAAAASSSVAAPATAAVTMAQQQQQQQQQQQANLASSLDLVMARNNSQKNGNAAVGIPPMSVNNPNNNLDNNRIAATLANSEDGMALGTPPITASTTTTLMTTSMASAAAAAAAAAAASAALASVSGANLPKDKGKVARRFSKSSKAAAPAPDGTSTMTANGGDAKQQQLPLVDIAGSVNSMVAQNMIAATTVTTTAALSSGSSVIAMAPFLLEENSNVSHLNSSSLHDMSPSMSTKQDCTMREDREVEQEEPEEPDPDTRTIIASSAVPNTESCAAQANEVVEFPTGPVEEQSGAMEEVSTTTSTGSNRKSGKRGCLVDCESVRFIDVVPLHCGMKRRSRDYRASGSNASKLLATAGSSDGAGSIVPETGAACEASGSKASKYRSERSKRRELHARAAHLAMGNSNGSHVLDRHHRHHRRMRSRSSMDSKSSSSDDHQAQQPMVRDKPEKMQAQQFLIPPSIMHGQQQQQQHHHHHQLQQQQQQIHRHYSQNTSMLDDEIQGAHPPTKSPSFERVYSDRSPGTMGIVSREVLEQFIQKGNSYNKSPLEPHDSSLFDSPTMKSPGLKASQLYAATMGTLGRAGSGSLAAHGSQDSLAVYDGGLDAPGPGHTRAITDDKAGPGASRDAHIISDISKRRSVASQPPQPWGFISDLQFDRMKSLTRQFQTRRATTSSGECDASELSPCGMFSGSAEPGSSDQDLEGLDFDFDTPNGTGSVAGDEDYVYDVYAVDNNNDDENSYSANVAEEAAAKAKGCQATSSCVGVACPSVATGNNSTTVNAANNTTSVAAAKAGEKSQSVNATLNNSCLAVGSESRSRSKDLRTGVVYANFNELGFATPGLESSAKAESELAGWKGYSGSIAAVEETMGEDGYEVDDEREIVQISSRAGNSCFPYHDFRGCASTSGSKKKRRKHVRMYGNVQSDAGADDDDDESDFFGSGNPTASASATNDINWSNKYKLSVMPAKNGMYWVGSRPRGIPVGAVNSVLSRNVSGGNVTNVNSTASTRNVPNNATTPNLHAVGQNTNMYHVNSHNHPWPSNDGYAVVGTNSVAHHASQPPVHPSRRMDHGR